MAGTNPQPTETIGRPGTRRHERRRIGRDREGRQPMRPRAGRVTMNVIAHAPWIAVQVRPRAEKIVTQHLEHRGYDCFLPLRNGVPLFAGYVFCRFARSARGPLVTTPGVTRIVSFAGVPAVIDDDEIAAIQQALASGLPVTVATVQAGDAVSVVHGPLRGVRGTVLHAGDRR